MIHPDNPGRPQQFTGDVSIDRELNVATQAMETMKMIDEDWNDFWGHTTQFPAARLASRAEDWRHR